MSAVEKSKILNKLKTAAKGAWKRARGVEAKARGGGGLPPNLKNVVAACQTYKMALTQKGDPYFSLTCIIKDPEELVGRRATFMWFINENEYATVEDNLNQLSNDLQLLNCEMPEDVGDVTDVLADLCEKGVHLLFNTGGPKKSGKSPSLFIQGLAEDWPDEPQDGAGEAEAKPAKGKGGNGKPKDEEESEDETTEETDESTEDESSEESTEEDTSEEAPWEPSKDEEYFYTPKGGKKTKVTVVAVDKKKKTFDLKGGKPPKVFKAVKWWKDKDETEASVEGGE